MTILYYRFDVGVTFSDCFGRTYEGSLETLKLNFADLFLPVRLDFINNEGNDADSAAAGTKRSFFSLCRLFEVALVRFKLIFSQGMWLSSKFLSVESVKLLCDSREAIFKCVSDRLGPFLVNEVDWDYIDIPDDDFDFEHEEWTICQASGKNVPSSSVEVESRFVAIFLPPRYHLLMRFSASKNVCLVRIKCDRYQLLR
jgi:hypothetical protein